MRIRLTIILTITLFRLSAQTDSLVFINDTSKVNPTEYLYKSTFIPDCYSSEKLKKLVLIKEGYRPTKITDAEFNDLTAYEHFVHSFYYREFYFQSCSIFGYPENVLQTIPALLKRQGEGWKMSIRQREALSQHRDSTIILMRDCINKYGKVNDEFKRAITYIKAYELIPTLISTAQYQKEIKELLQMMKTHTTCSSPSQNQNSSLTILTNQTNSSSQI